MNAFPIVPFRPAAFAVHLGEAARPLAGYVAVPLIEATQGNADHFRGDRFALDALFAFLTADRRRLGAM